MVCASGSDESPKPHSGCFCERHLSAPRLASNVAEVKHMVDTSKRVPVRRPEPRKETSSKPVTSPRSRVQKGADEAAHKAAKTEQEYDRNHTIISK